MSDESDIGTEGATASRRRGRANVVVLLVVAAVFAGVLLAKTASDRGGAGGPLASLTTVHNDAVEDYEAALKSGKPVYVLFHSLS